ncbi:MAG: YitT family protein [Candidatus Izemoplasmatales bacterium]|nr:YitT family protein [Candidatus Izemoplasmatales bacterium]
MKPRKIRRITFLEQWFFLTLGVLIMAVAFYFFVIPSGIVVGGVTGIAMIISRYLSWLPISGYAFIFNMVFLVLCFIFLGKREFIRSIYGSMLFPLFILIFELTVPNPVFSPADMLLVALYAGGLIGIGFAIVIHYGGTTGGTDIPIKIVKKYTRLSLAMSVYLIDASIILVGALTSLGGIGSGFIEALYALVVVFLSGKVADSFLLGIEQKKAVHIITDQPKAIKRAVFERFSRGMTEIKSVGGYTETEKTLLIMVIQNSEYHFVRNLIVFADPKAFVFVTPASEIHGEWSSKAEVFIDYAARQDAQTREETVPGEPGNE